MVAGTVHHAADFQRRVWIDFCTVSNGCFHGVIQLPDGITCPIYVLRYDAPSRASHGYVEYILMNAVFDDDDAGVAHLLLLPEEHPSAV
jgi:hypothetical protein